jgi:hypothetical protein
MNSVETLEGKRDKETLALLKSGTSETKIGTLDEIDVRKFLLHVTYTM